MNVTNLRNKLIVYKTYGNLNEKLVKEIQDSLINKTKSSEFENLLNKVKEETENK